MKSSGSSSFWRSLWNHPLTQSLEAIACILILCLCGQTVFHWWVIFNPGVGRKADDGCWILTDFWRLHRPRRMGSVGEATQPPSLINSRGWTSLDPVWIKVISDVFTGSDKLGLEVSLFVDTLDQPAHPWLTHSSPGQDWFCRFRISSQIYLMMRVPWSTYPEPRTLKLSTLDQSIGQVQFQVQATKCHYIFDFFEYVERKNWLIRTMCFHRTVTLVSVFKGSNQSALPSCWLFNHSSCLLTAHSSSFQTFNPFSKCLLWGQDLILGG